MRYAGSMRAAVLTLSLIGCAEDWMDEEPDLGGDEAALSRPDCDEEPSPEHALTAWAALPHTERTEGPTSGQFTSPANGVVPPFFDAQPIPGWSGLLDNHDGTYLAMPDNGFGAKGNSADYVLGFYRIRPKWKRRADGTSAPGPVKNERFVAFRDPKGLLKNGRGVDLTITADLASYRSGSGVGTDSGIAVDDDIRNDRLLTGYDFDIESIARAFDGSFWVGEEFGPYLLHFSREGVLLEEPVAHPFLKSPNHPEVLAGTAVATLGSSRGFESLAFDHARRYLYAVPEGAPSDDALRAVPGDERVVEFFEFDTRTRRYTGKTFAYRKDGDITGNAIVIGDMTNLAPHVFVLIERDSKWGASAVVKRLYLVDLRVTDADGILVKNLLVDLLDIDDPRDLGGELPGLAAGKFSMPFDSIECVLALDPYTLAVAIDTNFPGEDGRTPGVPDDSEVIQLRFERPVYRYAPRR